MVKKRLSRKNEYVPNSIVKHVERMIQEQHFPTRVAAYDEIAKELDEMIIKRRRKK